jgi:hypothetical protein
MVGSQVVYGDLDASGALSVNLPRLAPGKHRVMVMYAGSSTVSAQGLSVGWVTVTKPAAKTVQVTAAKKAPTTASRAKVTVKVAHPGVSAATGKVLIKVTKNGKTVVSKSYQLRAADKGKATVTLPRITKAGTYSVKATYAGNTVLAKKASKAIKLTVK